MLKQSVMAEKTERDTKSDVSPITTLFSLSH